VHKGNETEVSGLVECQHDSIPLLYRQCTSEKVLNRASRGRRRDIIKIFDFVIAMTDNYKLINCKIRLILSFLSISFF